MYWLYNFLIVLLFPVWLPWMLIRSRRRMEGPDWAQRQGQYQTAFDPKRLRLWVHAVSVGEVIAALPLLRELRRQEPDAQILLSVTTSSGHQTARDKAASIVDEVVYFPIDLAHFQLQAVGRVRPDAIAIMETELWFNFLWAAKTLKSRTMVVNGRISPRSFSRSRFIKPYYRALYRRLDVALMQTEEDRQRAVALGCPNPEVGGNLKYDEAIQAAEEASFTGWERTHEFIIVIGSTRGVEEAELVVDALRQLRGDFQVIHAPRHKEDADAVAALYSKAFGEVARRSLGQTGRFLVLDTYGELNGAYSVADLAVIGGGFSNHGGQNLIQPLAAGLPVVRGPHFQNFAQAAKEADEAGAARVAATSEELVRALQELLDLPEVRTKMSEAARAVVQPHAGAAKAMAARVLEQARLRFTERPNARA